MGTIDSNEGGWWDENEIFDHAIMSFPCLPLVSVPFLNSFGVESFLTRSE